MASTSRKPSPTTGDVLSLVTSLQPAFESFLVDSHVGDEPYWGSEGDFRLLREQFMPVIGRECVGYYMRFWQLESGGKWRKQKEGTSDTRSGESFSDGGTFGCEAHELDSWWDWSEMGGDGCEVDRLEVEQLVGGVLLGLIGRASCLFTRISFVRKNFPDSWITPGALEALCSGMLLPGCNTEDLNLDEIRACGTVEGCSHIAHMLQHSWTLKALALDNTGIGPEGARMLALALQTNCTLERLDVGRNPVGDEGALQLAHILHFNSTLSWLHLSNAGAEWLFSADATDIEWDW